MYYLIDGTEVTAEQIRQAYNAGNAVLVHGNRDNGTSTSLALDGVHCDTRDDCHSVWDEVWTAAPKTLNDALHAARNIYG
jgi:hypothetical protein